MSRWSQRSCSRRKTSVNCRKPQRYFWGQAEIHCRSKVTISSKSKTTTQDIYVVSGLKMGLLGRPAIHAVGIIARIDTVSLESLDSVKIQFPELF